MFFWNVNSPLTILLITLSSPFQRSPRDTKVLSRCLKCPWIFQRLADVNSCLVPIKRRGSLDRTAPNPPHVQPQQGSNFSPTEEKDPPCFFFQHHGQRSNSPPGGHLLLRLYVARRRRGLLSGDAFVGFPLENPTGKRPGEILEGK